MSESHDLVGAYALDALDADERGEFERHLAACPACTEETARLLGTAARLADLTGQAPPVELRSRVLAAAAGVRQLGPGTPAPASVLPGAGRGRGSATPPTHRDRRTPPRWLAAAAAVLVLAVFAGVVVGQEQRLRDARHSSEQASARAARNSARADKIALVLAAPDVRLKGATVGNGRVTVAVSESRNAGVVALSGLAVPGSGRVYQLWLVRAGKPVSAGLAGALGTRLLSDVRSASAVAMTQEPAGGSEQPTTKMLFALALR